MLELKNGRIVDEYGNSYRLARSKKLQKAAKSMYKPHQGRKECAKRIGMYSAPNA